MPKRLTFPSDLSATPQTPCLSFCCKEKYVDFVSQVSGVTLSADIYYFAHEDILLFSVEYGY